MQLSRWITGFVLVDALLSLQHWTVYASRWNFKLLIGNFGWSSYRCGTLDASSSRLLASLDAADSASSVFLSALLGSVWRTVSGLGSVPEVDDIFLWVNRNALLCTLLSFYVHTYPTSALLEPISLCACATSTTSNLRLCSTYVCSYAVVRFLCDLTTQWNIFYECDTFIDLYHEGACLLTKRGHGE